MEQFASRGVEDTICVGQQRPQDLDERVLLFVKMRPDQKFTAELVKEIESAIKAGLSSRHVPDFVLEVDEIPVSHCALTARGLFDFVIISTL